MREGVDLGPVLAVMSGLEPHAREELCRILGSLLRRKSVGDEAFDLAYFIAKLTGAGVPPGLVEDWEALLCQDDPVPRRHFILWFCRHAGLDLPRPRTGSRRPRGRDPRQDSTI